MTQNDYSSELPRQHDGAEESNHTGQSDLFSRVFDDWIHSSQSPNKRITEDHLQSILLLDSMPQAAAKDQTGGENNSASGRVELREVGDGDKPSAGQKPSDKNAGQKPADKSTDAKPMEGDKPAAKTVVPDVRRVSDFSIAKQQFDQLDGDTKDALEQAGIERFSVVSGRNGGKVVVIDFNDKKTIPMDASTGCRQFEIAKKLSLEIGQDRDGNIILTNIRGLKATLTGQPPVEAVVERLVLRKGADGKPELEITGAVNGQRQTAVVKIPDAISGKAEDCMKHLGGLLDVAQTGAFGQLPADVGGDNSEVQIPHPINDAPEVARAKEQDKEFVKGMVLLAALLGGTLVVGRTARNFFRRSGNKPDAKPDDKPDTKPESKPDTQPDTKPDAKPDSKPDSKPDTNPDAKPGVKPVDMQSLELREPTAKPGDADVLREQARRSGNPLINPDAARELVDGLVGRMSGWSEDLSSRWAATANQRSRVQEAYERALSLAKEEARKKVGASEVDKEAARLLVTPNEALSNNRAFTDAQREFLTRREDYLKQTRTMNLELTARQKELQAEVDKYCDKHGLPKLIIDLKGNFDRADGAYVRGRGVMSIDNRDLLSTRTGTRLVSRLTQQLSDAHQDSLIARDIIDSLPDRPKVAGVVLSAEQVAKVQAEYRKRTGADADPSPSYLQEVNKVRAGNDLTAEQHAAATAYAAEFTRSKDSSKGLQLSADHYRATANELGLLDSRSGATDLVRRLSQPGNEALCEHLFGVKSIDRLPDFHPAKLILKELMEKHAKASLGGKIVPKMESDIWSERAAKAALEPLLLRRMQDLNSWRQAHASTLPVSAAAQESALVAREATTYGERGVRDIELHVPDRPLPPSNIERDLFLAAEREWRELFPTKPLPSAYNRDFKTCMEVALARLQAEQVDLPEADAHAMSKIVSDYDAPATANGKQRPGVERLNYVAECEGRLTMATDPKYADRLLSLGYDPVPVNQADLARLGTDSRIELTHTGIRELRKKYLSELMGERELTKDELLKVMRDHLKDVEEEFKRRPGPISEEEQAYVRGLRAATEEFAKQGEVPRPVREALERTRRGSGEVVGTAIGVGIIATALLGWYIQYKANRTQMEALPPLEFG